MEMDKRGRISLRKLCIINYLMLALIDALKFVEGQTTHEDQDLALVNLAQCYFHKR